MAVGSNLEMRLEVYPDGTLAPSLVTGISQLLARRWPGHWDVKTPSSPTLDHPAEWRAVIPLPDGATPESLHKSIESEILALDFNHQLHLRTRWAFAESPNHQEVYEVRWASQPR